MKVSSTYYAFCTNGGSGANADLYTSSNGETWTVSVTNIFASSAQSWMGGGSLGNISVTQALSGGSNYVALVEAAGTDGIWRTGVWTTSGGVGGTYTPYSGNPVLPTNGMSSTGMCGGPDFVPTGGSYYYVYEHCNGPNGTGSGKNPTEIYAFTSTNGTTWTPAQTAPVLARATFDEGAGTTGTSAGQVADAEVVQLHSNLTCMYYTADEDGYDEPTNPIAGQHQKVACTPYSLATVIASSQSDQVNGPLSFGLNNPVPPAITWNSGGACTYDAHFAGQALQALTTVSGQTCTLTPTNLVGVGSYTLKIINASSTAATLTLGTSGSSCAAWKVINGGSGAVTLSGASKTDFLAFTFDGTNCYAVLQ